MPRRRSRALLLALSLLLAGPTCAALADVRASALTIGQPWSWATPKGARVGAGYLTITNTGSEPDRLVGLALASAGRVEIHAVTMAGGVMRMHPVEGGLEIGPGQTVTLGPGGQHVMFLDLTDPFREGETVEVTLTFERAGAVRVPFKVEGVGALRPEGGMPGHKP